MTDAPKRIWVGHSHSPTGTILDGTIDIDRSEAAYQTEYVRADILAEAADEIARLRARVQQYEERLEITHTFLAIEDGDDYRFERVEIPYDERPTATDGIECRDATIAILEGHWQEVPIDAANNAEPKYFRGVSYEIHDGTMKLVDLRGLFPEAKLVLSAGGKEVSCVVPRTDVEMLRNALNRRVLVSGQSQYDGHSMVPSRIDVTSIKVVEGGGNIIEVRGVLRDADPFAIEEIG